MPERRPIPRLAVVLIVALVAYAAWVTLANSTLRGDVAEMRAAVATLASNYEGLRQADGVEAPPVDELVEGVDPPEEPAPTVVVTEQLSAEQVDAALADYCAERAGCRGPSGVGPSPADVYAALVEYCADGSCQGAAGNDGRDGNDGQDGKDGPPPTAEVIAQAVADYCADGACMGQQGDAGAKGADGRGVDSIGCVDGQLVVTYTDGARETVDGATACEPPGLLGLG